MVMKISQPKPQEKNEQEDKKREKEASPQGKKNKI